MPLEKASELARGKKDWVTEGIQEGENPGETDHMPIVPLRVLHTGLPIYTDKNCRRRAAKGEIAILLPLDPDAFKILDVVPTCKKYQVGQYLTWQLDKDQLWEECYYRNPESGQVEQAWTMHVEFVGRVISPKTLAENREKLEKLEGLYKQDGPVM